MSIRWRNVVLILAAFAALFPWPMQAQRPQQMGKISGQVRVSRSDFPSVPVLVTLEFRGSPIQSAYCDDQGRFAFTNLVANEYRISVNDDAYQPLGENVNVNPEISQTNFVQLVLVPRAPKKKEDPANRVPGSNPYLIDPTEYYRRFPKKTIKEFESGIAADRQGKIDEAIGHYEKAVSYSPDFYPAHNNLGSAYVSRKDFERAKREFETALQINQNDAQAYLNLGNVLLMTQKFDEAERQIEAGLQRRPDSAFGYFLRGSLHARTGRTDSAERSLTNALQLDPLMSQAHLQLVNLYLQQKRTPDAIRELEVYVKAFPDTPFSPKAKDLLRRLQAEIDAH